MKLYLNSMHIADVRLFKFREGTQYLAILEKISIEADRHGLTVEPFYKVVVEVQKTSTTAVIIRLVKRTILLNFRHRKVEVKIEHSLPNPR
jgi:hypothetical protein